MKRLGLALLLGCTAMRDRGFGHHEHPQAPPTPPPATFAWPTPDTWTKETRGMDELRVGPDGSEVLLWWNGPRLERAVIEAHLKEHYAGDAHLEANRQPGLVGTVRTSDGVLNVHATTGACGDRRFLLVEASPKPMADPTWRSLNEIASAFQCRP